MVAVGVRHDGGGKVEAAVGLKPGGKKGAHVAALSRVDDDDAFIAAGLGRDEHGTVALAHIDKDDFERPAGDCVCFGDVEGAPLGGRAGGPVDF